MSKWNQDRIVNCCLQNAVGKQTIHSKICKYSYSGKHQHFTLVSASLDKRFLGVVGAPFQPHPALDQWSQVETKEQCM